MPFDPRNSLTQLLNDVASRAARYAAEAQQRHTAPLHEDVARLETLATAFPRNSSDPAEVLATLDEIGSPATLASTGRRYFGYVTGGVLPAALAANWMAGAWTRMPTTPR